MIIYLIIFIISLLFTYIAQEMFKRQKKIGGIFFSIFAILFPAGLAGLRATTIGTDVNIYGENYFNLACIAESFAQYQELCSTDFLYAVLNYVVSRFTNNINWFFFIMQLVILIPIYVSAYQHRKEKSMVFFMFVTFFLFFNRSLNELRQCIAVAFIVLGIKYAEDRKLLKFTIIITIATLFHISALMAIPIYVIFGTKNFKHKRLFEVFLILGTSLIIINLVTVLQLGINMGILPAKYSYYLGNYLRTTSDINILDLIMRIFFTILGYIVYKTSYKKNKKVESYLLMMLMDFILAQSGMFVMYIDRMALYYGIPAYIQYIPLYEKGFKQDRFNKVTIKLICGGILIVYWYLKFVYLGYGETVPYESYILGI